MQHDSPHGSKAKILAWCVAIAAVAIIYIFMSGQGRSSSALTPSSNATATTTMPNPSSSSGATSNSMSNGTGNSTNGSSSAGNYKDGTYTATGSYRTPDSIESIQVTLAVSGGSVNSVSVQQSATNRDSAAYQEAFQQSYKPYVVGKKLSDIYLSRVSGSSLTSIGFNQALDQIKSQAQG